MIQICLSSDSCNKYLLLNYHDLKSFFKKINIVLDDFKYHETIDQNESRVLKELLSEEIIRKIELKKDSEFGILKQFGSFILKFDLSVSDDFYLAMLIDFFNIVEKTIDSNGRIYLFNRSKLNKNVAGNIIAMLKIKLSLSKTELKNMLINLNEKFNLKLKLDDRSLDDDLFFLQSLGFIDFDGDENKYKLTGKGYMLIL